MVDIKFRKLYAEVKEGQVSMALITFMKAPVYVKQGRYIGWRNALRLDLWFCVVQFEWESWTDEK